MLGGVSDSCPLSVAVVLCSSVVFFTVAAAAECAERGGRCSGIRIGDQLSPAQRTTVEQPKASHGSPHGTIMLGGQHVSLEVAPEGA